MNTVRFAHHLARAKLTGGAIPFQVTINLLDACNLRCTYCYVSYPHRQKRPMPHERLLALIDELAAAGTIKINLAGGEPLLYKPFEDVVDRIVGHGIDCYVNTNGYFIDKHLDSLRRIARLNVSIDGNEASHDLPRGQGSWAKAWRALEVAEREGIPRLMTAVLGTHNADQLDWLVATARRFDAGLVVLPLLTPRNLPPSGHELGEKLGRELFTEVVRRKRAGEPFVYSAEALETYARWPLALQKDTVSDAEFESFPQPHVKCSAGRFYCVVDTDGTLHPCCATIGLYQNPPSLVETSFLEAFAHLRGHGCRACNASHFVDMNLVFDLRPRAVGNALAVALPGGGPRAAVKASVRRLRQRLSPTEPPAAVAPAPAPVNK